MAIVDSNLKLPAAFIMRRIFIVLIYYCFIVSYFAAGQTQEASSITSAYSQHQHNDPFDQYQGDLFVAIEVPGEVKADLQILQGEIESILGSSFVPTKFENFHITVQLIGKTTDHNLLEAIDWVLEDQTKSNAIVEYNQQYDTIFSLGQELAFGSIKISGKYVKLHFCSEVLSNFAKQIRSKLKINGIAVSSRFDFPKNAHITLGRVNKSVNSKKKREIKRSFDNALALLQTFTKDQFQVTYFSILKSNFPESIYNRHYARIRSYKICHSI